MVNSMMSWTVRFGGPSLGPIALGAWCMLFSLVTSLLMLTVPIYMMHVYDSVIATGSVATLVALTVVAVGLLFVQGLLDAIRGRVLARAALRLEHRLSRPLGERLLALPLQANASSEHASLGDLGTIRGFFSGPAVTAFFDAPLVPVFLVIATILHPLFGVVALAAAVLLMGFAIANDVLTQAPARDAARHSVLSRRWLEDASRQAESIDALGMSGRVLERWQTQFRAMQSAQLRASERGITLVAGSRACRLFAQISVLATGAGLVLSDAITPGVMIGASFIIARALAPMEGAIAGWRQARASMAAWRRVQDTLALPPRRETGMTLPAPVGKIDVEAVRFTPAGGERPVLDNLSFALAPGKQLALIGPSGSGKSTLARLLIGIHAADSGHVRLDGADVFGRARSALAPYIGYLPQSVELLGATVADAIARMGAADPELVVDAAERAGAHEMILRLPRGYDTPIIDNGRNLSGGQRQWIGLARALYGRPRLVVLDEPDSNLDGRGENALVNALQTLRGEGATVVLIGHSLSLCRHADYVLVLGNGGSAAFGSRESILAPMARPAMPANASLRTDSGQPARLGRTERQSLGGGRGPSA